MNEGGASADRPPCESSGDLRDPSPGDDPFDELAEDFAARCRRGESPSIEGYAAGHPEHAARLRGLLPTVAMMEQLKRRSRAAGDREPARAMPGRLGEFRVVRELGRGGMGVVYEAVQEPLGRHIALKVIHHPNADARRLLRFRREAMAVAQLHHTNIVPIFAVGEHDGLPFFAMQYIRGESLDAALRRWRSGGGARRDPARWRFAAKLGMQAAEALQHAHEQGVLHRDIKPANLLIDEHEAVWITDFGLAKLAGQDDLTSPGDVIGTLRYLAPEALQGPSGPRGDVYSLGLTLYEMLTLSPPFGDLSPSEMLHQLGSGHLPRPRLLDPEIPRDLETIVLKAIAREPGHRYASAGDLADDLRRFLEDRPIRARRANAAERLWLWGRRNRATAALSGIAAGALLLTAVVGWIGYAMRSAALDEARANLVQANIHWIKAEGEARRADANAEIPLDFIAELVSKIVAREEARGRDPGPPAGVGGPEMPPGAMAVWPPPPPGPPRPGPAPTGPPRHGLSAADSELFGLIAAFYDRLAEMNRTDPALRGEAAWVFFKLGVHDERMNDPAKGEAECDRALAIFEDLAADRLDDRRCFARLAKFPDMIEPDSVDPGRLGAIERRLRRIDGLLLRLASAHPDVAEDRRALMRGRTKLARTLARMGRRDEAEAVARAAIGEAAILLEAGPRDADARIDLLEARLIPIRMRVERGHLDEAWSLFPAVFAVMPAEAGEIRSLEVAIRMEDMADAYRKAGQFDRADALNWFADLVDPRPPLDAPARPGMPWGARPDRDFATRVRSGPLDPRPRPPREPRP